MINQADDNNVASQNNKAISTKADRPCGPVVPNFTGLLKNKSKNIFQRRQTI